jgi:hypothetical protein
MPREKADYRDLLERLDVAFPNKEMLTKTEVAEWLGVGRATINRRYGWPRGKVTKTQVARAVASSR